MTRTNSDYIISASWFCICSRNTTAVQRVRDYIQFVDGKIPLRPTMATALDDDIGIERWTVPSIVELLRESQKLSENIYLAEIEVQNIDRLLKLLNECRRDNENYINQLLVKLKTINVNL